MGGRRKRRRRRRLGWGEVVRRRRRKEEIKGKIQSSLKNNWSCVSSIMQQNLKQ